MTINHFIKLILFSLFLLNSSIILAAQNKDAEDGDEITAEISRSDINRIKLAGDRIRSLKSNSGELELSQDDHLGEVYLRPANPSENKPINLFIATEQNFTYKLLLYPKSIPSEQIIIKNDAVLTNSNQEIAKSTKSSYQQQIISLMKAMRSKNKIEGYQIKNARKNIDLGDLTLKRISTYKGQSFLGEIFTLKNNSGRFLNLEESIFFKNGVRAIKIENHELFPGDITEIYIVS